MSIVSLTDGSSLWFETESAVTFSEGEYWDGCNHVSLSTGSQWKHQCLYYTRSGRWVLNTWGDWQGTWNEYVHIDESVAVEWLICNKRFNDTQLAKLPKSVQESIANKFSHAEI
jgi:hypothetical protein